MCENKKRRTVNGNLRLPRSHLQGYTPAREKQSRTTIPKESRHATVVSVFPSPSIVTTGNALTAKTDKIANLLPQQGRFAVRTARRQRGPGGGQIAVPN